MYLDSILLQVLGLRKVCTFGTFVQFQILQKKYFLINLSQLYSLLLEIHCSFSLSAMKSLLASNSAEKFNRTESIIHQVSNYSRVILLSQLLEESLGRIIFWGAKIFSLLSLIK
jgi:hypothetical protein